MPYESPLQKALREQREQALVATSNNNGKNAEQKNEFNFGSIEKAKDRIAIIADDSGSMGVEKMQDAKDGMIEFMRNCVPIEVACAIYPLNDSQISLSTNLPQLSIKIADFRSTGGTPLFETLKKAQREKSITRYIIFSDGEPNSENNKESCLNEAIERKTPIDTVLIADDGWTEESLKQYRAYLLLKEIADRTGGYFLVFQRGKVNFKTAFKYLSPGLRLMLTDDNTRVALQEGRLK